MLIAYRGKTPKIHATAFVAPTAVIIGDVEIGEESSIWFGTVIRGDNGPIRIGARTNVQDNAVVHVGENSRTIIGNDVTVGHAAIMEDCVIEDGALVGSNVVILNYSKIGKRALIGAGSVVPVGADIPAEVLAAGSPAKVKKPLDGASVTWVERAGPEYVHLSRTYLEGGVGAPSTHEVRGSGQ